MSFEDFLQEVVQGGNIGKLFTHPKASAIHRLVDFSKTPPTHDMQKNRFRIKLHNGFPPQKQTDGVVCLFPNQTHSKHILESRHYSNRDEFNKELNMRFIDSPDYTEQFKDNKLLVLFGSHCFICGKITGTIYIVWAEYVTRINASNIATIPYKNIPIVLNCDGLATIKSMYILRPQIENKFNELSLLPMTQGNPTLIYDMRYSPFVCEKRPEKYVEHKINTVSPEEAHALVTQNTQDVQDWLHYETVPFSSMYTSEGFVEIDHDEDSRNDPWIESPPDIFLNSNVKSDDLKMVKESDVRIFISKKEPDPFK